MYFLGIDLGTSGIRCAVIDEQNHLIKESSISYSESDELSAIEWWEYTVQAIKKIPCEIRSDIVGMSVDGTSGTVLVTDQNGSPLTAPLRYDDLRAELYAEKIRALSNSDSPATSSGGSLAKTLWLLDHYQLASSKVLIVHQADFIIGQLTGQFSRSDFNNVLKLGFNPEQYQWFNWFDLLDIDPLCLPKVQQPGDLVGNINPHIQRDLGVENNCLVFAGTTDSIAAFYATGAYEEGTAVTSLGSSLVLKVISNAPINDVQKGIYSHRFQDRWLVGGASNVGAKVLRDFFSDDQMHAMTPHLNPSKETGLNYYPLCGKGERFPENNPNKMPHLTPRPDSDLLFFQGLLESIAEIEKQGYDLLVDLGASPINKVITVGGGSKNDQWSKIRQKRMKVPVNRAKHSQASYGMALLARNHYPLPTTI